MIGLDAHGTLALGEIPPAAAVASQIAPVYLSSHGFRSEPADTPGNTHFAGGVTSALVLRRSMLAGDRIGGGVAPTGRIVLDNSDGRHDAMLTDWAIDGRRVRVLMGAADFAYADYGTLFDGTARGWDFGETSITIELRDSMLRFAEPVQQSLYDGSGGLDGTDDLAGKPRPLTYGQVFNISPVPIAPGALVYQVHDGSCHAVDAVYDRGAELTGGADYADYAALVAASVGAGTFATSRAAGLIRLGGSPTGQVTADVRGDNADGYISDTAAIVERIVTTRGGLAAGDIDAGSFGAVSTKAPGAVGIYVAGDRTVRSVIDDLMVGIGGYYAFSRANIFGVGMIEAPAGGVALELPAYAVRRLERVALPRAVNPPIKRRRLGYARNWTVQASDLAGVVDDDRRAFLAEQYRVASAYSGAAATKHLAANDPDPLATLFVDEADATTEAARQLSLWSGALALYRVRTGAAAMAVELGHVVRVTYPRFGFEIGRLGRVVGLDEDATRGTVDIEVLA